MFKIYFLFLFINLILFLCHYRISKVYNLYDYPDKKRKLHTYPIPLLGGIFIILNFLLFYLFDIFYLISTNNSFFLSLNNNLIFFIVSLSFFFLGYFDDKYKLSPNVKLLSTILLLLLATFLDRDLLLTKIRFTFYSKEIFLGNYSYPVTVICFLLFINAFNMLDGINGQAATYAIYIFLIFIFNKILINFSFILIIFLLFFLILNFKNKSYLGDSGSILLGCIISYLFIKSYNVDTKFYADEIFLIMSIPGYELLRLAIKRIIDKKHPFYADNNHIHHLIINKFNLAKSYLIIQVLLVFPYFFYLLLNNFFYSLFLSLAIYSLCIYFFSRK